MKLPDEMREYIEHTTAELERAELFETGQKIYQTRLRDINRKENEKLIERSGHIQSNSKLVAFLYDLVKMHLPAGVVETLVRDAQGNGGDFNFCNGYLAQYCIDLAKRLEGPSRGPDETD
jgi:hypothetical protein